LLNASAKKSHRKFEDYKEYYRFPIIIGPYGIRITGGVVVNKHINEVIFVTYYPPELKANVVKNRVEKGKNCSQLSKDYNIPERKVQKWVKKFRDWDENYTCFFNNSINKSSVVSHDSKVPPVIYLVNYPIF